MIYLFHTQELYKVGGRIITDTDDRCMYCRKLLLQYLHDTKRNDQIRCLVKVLKPHRCLCDLA